jgi:hypothetical protein
MRLPGIQALLLALGLTLAGAGALAGEADVIDTRVTLRGGGVFDFDVTIRSNDLGWDHYADAFEVLAPDGTLLGRRVLLHPHETEQPFTRDLHGVAIPDGVREVTIRAHHQPAGYDGATLTVALPR